MRFKGTKMPSVVRELLMQEMKHEFETNPYAFISNFEGLTVADLSDLRRSLSKVAKRSLLVKHSFVKKVFAARQLSETDPLLKGSVLVTFGEKEPQMISKALVEFARTNQKLVPAGVIFENKVFGQDFVKRLAMLPSRHDLLTQMVVRVKSPISGLVLTLGQVMRGLAVALNAIREKKAVAGGAA